jgi:hypothetical protein
MEHGISPATPPQDTGPPDAVETDPAALSSAEDLDEDRLRADPLEAGIEPPERWAGADRFGTTTREQREGQDLDARLAEEQPEAAIGEPDSGPGDEPKSADLNDRFATDEPELSVEYLGGEVESAVPDGDYLSDAARRGQSADEAGGSVGDAIRTPDAVE